MNRSRLNSAIWKFAHLTLKMDDEAYRNVIREVTTEKEKVSLCTVQEAELVLIALRRFHSNGRLRGPDKSGSPGRPPTQEGISAPTILSGQERQHSIIPRLMERLRWDWRSTAKFCEKITGKKRTDKCTAAELSKVIAGMVQIVEYDLKAGKITMTDRELQEFRKHTRSHRSSITNPQSAIVNSTEAPCK